VSRFFSAALGLHRLFAATIEAADQSAIEPRLRFGQVPWSPATVASEVVAGGHRTRARSRRLACIASWIRWRQCLSVRGDLPGEARRPHHVPAECPRPKPWPCSNRKPRDLI